MAAFQFFVSYSIKRDGIFCMIEYFIVTITNIICVFIFCRENDGHTTVDLNVASLIEDKFDKNEFHAKVRTALTLMLDSGKVGEYDVDYSEASPIKIKLPQISTCLI